MAAVLCCRALAKSFGVFEAREVMCCLVGSRNIKIGSSLQGSSTEGFQVDPERLKQIEDSPSGWVPPSENTPALPFSIRRSRLNNIPVYTDIKAGGTRQLTVIRKVKGDLEALEKLLRSRLGDDLVVQRNELTGQVKIKGNYKDRVVTILKEVGF